jgi:S-adenosylmethionine:tRNA ribosyltransferase-isomerase
MHEEYYEVPKNLEEHIKRTKKQGKKIWAVGTTVVRTLETAFDKNLSLVLPEGFSSLFIRPGYNFKVVDAMITNFHHPETTLMYLVSAFAGTEQIVNAYQHAIKSNYRFLSYGDSMLIV